VQREPDDGEDAVPEEKPRFEYRREGLGGKAIALIVAGILLLIFFLQNLHRSDVNFLFWDWDVAIAIAILVAAALGFVIGWAFGRMARRTKKAKGS
jgi:uncharacterized integral membrane protein